MAVVQELVVHQRVLQLVVLVEVQQIMELLQQLAVLLIKGIQVEQQVMEIMAVQVKIMDQTLLQQVEVVDQVR